MLVHHLNAMISEQVYTCKQYKTQNTHRNIQWKVSLLSSPFPLVTLFPVLLAGVTTIASLLCILSQTLCILANEYYIGKESRKFYNVNCVNVTTKKI